MPGNVVRGEGSAPPRGVTSHRAEGRNSSVGRRMVREDALAIVIVGVRAGRLVGRVP